MDEPTGFKQAIAVALGQLPHILVAAVTAIFIFLGGLWLDNRDIGRELADLKSAQQPPAFCERVSLCAAVNRIGGSISNCERSADRIENSFVVHEKNDQQWQQRIVRLEQQVFDLSALARGYRERNPNSMGGMSGMSGMGFNAERKP